MKNLVEIPFHGTAIHAVSDDGKPLVSLRHTCEAIGIDTESQRKRLSRQPWATTVMMTAVAEDGKLREMAMLDRRTFTSWLTSVDTSRVKNEAAKEMLVNFQLEAADALDSYFHDGGAINPRASQAQLSDLEQRAREARLQAEVVEKLRGILPDQYLENKSRIILARAMGEAPQIAPEDMQLIAEGYLKGKSLNAKDAKSVRSTFGRRVSKAYFEHHGEYPPSAPSEVGGRVVDIKHYTERDRHLFDQVWDSYYADLYEPNLVEELA